MSDDELLRELRGLGADIDGAMERFLDDAELYRSCLESFANDKGFEALGLALERQSFAEAFDCAHTLKGVAANLGLSVMLRAISQVVEPLRAGESGALTGEYAEILRLRRQLLDLLS